MRNLKHLFILLLSSLCSAFSLYAADVQMTLDRNLISLLDRAVLKVEFIDTTGDAIEIPPVDGLNIRYQGQQQSSNIEINNGRYVQKQRLIHTYVITPSKVGEYTIGPVECKYKGGTKTLRAKLKVIKSEDDPEAQALSEMLFSKVTASRTDPFVHEPFQLDLFVHIRDGVQVDGHFGLQGGMPETGIKGEPEWEIIGQERKEINGKIYLVHHLRTTIETLTAGTFTFQPHIQLNMVVPRQQRRPFGTMDPFFGDFFGRQETRAIVLECNPLEVEVRTIPTANRPDSYSGAIGTFNFDVTASPSKLKAGEPITLKMRVWGNGNLSQITPPPIPANPDFKLYEATTQPSQNANEVCFEQVIIPKSGDLTEIPPITFSYFNSKTSDFRTITKGPFPLEVEAVPNAQMAKVIATLPNAVAPKETKVLGLDIIYLKPKPAAWTYAQQKQWHQTDLLKLIFVAPLAALGLIAFITFRRDKRSNDTAFARRQKAPKAARKGLSQAQQALHKKETASFYEALWDTLAAYFGHRLNLAPGEVSLAIVLQHLPDSTSELAKNLSTLFETIDQRRYGIGGDPTDSPTQEMKNDLKTLTETLKKCERMKL